VRPILPSATGLVLAGLLLLSPRDLLAQPFTPAPERLTLEEALARLNDTNASLLAARAEIAVAEARRITAGARQNPVLGLSREQLYGSGRSYQETILALDHTFEVGGQRSRRLEVAGRGVEATRADVEATRWRLASELRRLYVHAAAAEAALVPLQEAADVFRRVEAAGRARLAEGDISAFERRRLQVERARYESLIVAARLDLVRLGRALALLASPDSVAEGAITLPSGSLQAYPLPEVSLDSVLAAVQSRPDVRALEAEAHVLGAELALQEREHIPDLTVSGGYKHQSDGLMGPVVGLSLPIPLLDRNRGRIAEAEARLRAAELRRRSLIRSAEDEVRLAWESYQALRAQRELLLRDLLGDVEALLRTALVSYDEGEMSLVELLDAADAYRTARQASLTLQADALAAYFDLLSAMGR
jgi:cobalt-zinc-cadmium efflux system outer membrane protein